MKRALETCGIRPKVLIFVFQKKRWMWVVQKKKIFEEIITENFPNLGKETRIQVQEVQGILNKMNTKKPTLKHFIIKLAKIKEKILKVARKKQVVTYKCPHIGQSADFWAGITILKSVKKILRQKE